MLLIILLMTQLGWNSRVVCASKALESPSKIIMSQFSSLASYVAHKMADASAWSAEQSWWFLAQSFTATPLSLLATTTSVVEVGEVAASTFSLSHSRCGSCQPRLGFRGVFFGGNVIVLSDLNSASLRLKLMMEVAGFGGMLEKIIWFLVLHTSPNTSTIIKVMLQWFSRRSGALGCS